ncbi:hypothetical protein [Agromyces sp. NPDC058104]|uniref:hypothetical protein n=1 Tax=Agromyces sp. NPDC058104 TaxID=3346342 RepID=UPI0036DA4DFA
MSTWNSITIANAPAELKLEDIFTRWPELTRDGEIWESRDEDDEREAVTPSRAKWQPIDTPREEWAYQGRDASPEGDITITGHSKYRATSAESALYELSAAYPEITVSWSQEWDDDEPGQCLDVIRAGEIVRESSLVVHMVPMTLPDLIAAAREALASDVKAVHENGGVTYPVDDALRALLLALEPEEETK